MSSLREESSSDTESSSTDCHNNQDNSSQSVAVAKDEPKTIVSETSSNGEGIVSRYERRIANWTVVVGVFTFVLAIVTGYSAYVLHVTDQTLKDTLEHSRKSGERQLRAYLLVSEAEVTLQGGAFEAAVDFKNFGQTPAYDVKGRIRLVGWEADGLPPFETHTPPYQASALVGPGGTFGLKNRVTITNNDPTVIAAYRNGQGIFYVFGQVEYRDTFNRRWVTKFRMRSEKATGNLWILGATDAGNEEAEIK